MRVFDTGATRDDDTDKLDFEGFFSPEFIGAFAQYMHTHRVQADGQLRDSDNWQKGIPAEAYMKSLWRHFYEVWALWRANNKSLSPGMVEALCAMTFNVQGLITLQEREQQTAGQRTMERLAASGIDFSPAAMDRARSLEQSWREAQRLQRDRSLKSDPHTVPLQS